MAVTTLNLGKGTEGRGPRALSVRGAWSAERAYACSNEEAWQPWQ